MKYSTFPPPANLSNYIRFFWVFEGSAFDAQPYIHRTPANVCPELIFHYHGAFHEVPSDETIQGSFQAGVHAQTDRFRRFIVKENFGIFGIYLYPYALPALFGIPADELTNELPDLSLLLSQSNADIVERVYMAADVQERIAIISDFFGRKITELRRPEMAIAVRSIIASNGNVRIGDLSERCCISVRQFERHFKTLTGFTPKTFARICRFNAVIALTRKPEGPLTDVAYRFGYYDQSHFIQDFKQFSGYNPRSYFTGQAAELL